MDDLTDDRPLTAGGETTFELIDHYLLVSMEDLVNGKLICCGKNRTLVASSVYNRMHFSLALSMTVLNPV